MSRDRRIGRFFIESDIIEYYPDLARQVLKDVIIVRAEHLFAYDSMEYMGISEAFEEIKAGELAPLYQPIMENEEFKGFRGQK